MSIETSPETIFLEEYWQPIPEATTYHNIDDGIVRRVVGAYKEAQALVPTSPQSKGIASAIKAQVNESMCLAMNSIIEGNPGDLINTGEPIATPKDNSYALPGAVLLVDTEKLVIETPFFPLKITTTMSEAQVCMSGSSFLLSGRKISYPGEGNPNKLNQFLHAPFNGYWVSKDGSAYYERSVNLFAFCLNKKGDLASLALADWADFDGNPRAHTKYNYPAYPPNVGEVANSLWATSVRSLTRIREARVCLTGIKQHAPEKVRSRPRFSLKQLVPSAVTPPLASG